MAHGAFNSIDVGVTGNLQMAMPEIYRNLPQLRITLSFGLLFWLLLLGRDRRKSLNAVQGATTS